MSNLSGEPQTVSETPSDVETPEFPAAGLTAAEMPEPRPEPETPVALKDKTVEAYMASDDDEDGTIHAHPSEMPVMLQRYASKAEDLFHKVIHLQSREEMQASFIGTQAKIIEALCARLKAADINPDDVLSEFTLAPNADNQQTEAPPKDGGKY